MNTTQEINLFGVETSPRNYDRGITSHQRKVMSDFGYEYFDDPTYPGYGGYHYNGVWQKPAQAIAEHFRLEDSSTVLDVGCAKGFLLRDLEHVNPTFHVNGVDISRYAIENCDPSVKSRLEVSCCTNLPYADSSFDLVISIGTLHNLNVDDVGLAIREINRVSKGNSFIMVHSFRNDNERKNLLNWEATIQTALSTVGWARLFAQENYTGNYCFQVFEEAERQMSG